MPASTLSAQQERAEAREQAAGDDDAFRSDARRENLSGRRTKGHQERDHRCLANADAALRNRENRRHFGKGPRKEPHTQRQMQPASDAEKHGDGEKSALDADSEQPGEQKTPRMPCDFADGTAHLNQSPAKPNGSSAQKRPQRRQREKQQYSCDGDDQEQTARRRQDQTGRRTGEQTHSGKSQSKLRTHINDAVRQVPGDHRSWPAAVRDTDSQAHHIAAHNRRQKKGTKDSSGVALRADREGQTRIRGIHHQMPFKDADGESKRINHEQNSKPRERNMRKRLAKRRHREEMDQQSNDE